MARLLNGLMGGISGKIGNMEAYVLNGRTYLRAAKKIKNTAPTEKQLAARMRLNVVNRFINSMTSYVGVGFALFARDKTFSANNAAKSYQLKHAVNGEYPNFEIAYPNVLLSTGSYPMALNPVVSVLDACLQFNWELSPMDSAYTSNGQTMLLAYCPELQKSHYKIGGASRYSGIDSLSLPDTFKGKRLECYLSFVADDRKAISDSSYLGSLQY
ncbi:MAG: DUF6266 family protein [Bacteroidota bacterium]